MLRDNPVGSSHQCLENPRPAGAELSLTEDVTSPFQAEPRQPQSLDLARNDADHFDTAEGSGVLTSEVSKTYCLLRSIVARIVMRVEDVDLESIVFVSEHQHVRIHRLRLPLPIGDA